MARRIRCGTCNVSTQVPNSATRFQCKNCGTLCPVAPGLGKNRNRRQVAAFVIVLLLFGAGAWVWVTVTGDRSGGSAWPDAGSTSAFGVTAQEVCTQQLKDFSAALHNLDSRLGVGLSFAEYGTAVADAKVANDSVPLSELDAGCLNTATLEVAAFDQYVKAFGEWNRCVGHLLTCNFDQQVKPHVQRRWASASRFLARAGL